MLFLFLVPVVDELSSLIMSSGSRGGSTRLNTSLQELSDEIICANQENSNNTKQTDHDFQIPMKNIDYFLSEVSTCCDASAHIKLPFKTLSVSSCSSQHTVTLSEEAGNSFQFQPSSLDQSTLQARSEKCLERPNADSKSMYPTNGDSDSKSDSNTESILMLSKMADGTLH